MMIFELIVASVALAAGLGLIGLMVYECAVFVYGEKGDDN